MRHKFHTLRHSGNPSADGASRISMVQRDSGQATIMQTDLWQARMTNSENNSRGEGGQTLVEVLLALGVAVIIITAITSVVIVALNNASFSKNQNLANAYAQEGMEVIRAIRDQSWLEFDNLSGNPNRCLEQDSRIPVARTGPNCAGPGQGDIFVGGTHFIREITINDNHSNCKPAGPTIENHKVTVSVGWGDGKCHSSRPFCHEARLVSCFGQKSSNVVAP